jgi:AhpD family alkylhydroperoxidase
LIALAIGIATRCDGCIGFHTEALIRLGVTRQEFQEALGMAVYMGGGPSLMSAADAISAFEEFQDKVGIAAWPCAAVCRTTRCPARNSNYKLIGVHGHML